MTARRQPAPADWTLPATVTSRSAQVPSAADLPLLDGAVMPAYPDGSEEE